MVEFQNAGMENDIEVRRSGKGRLKMGRGGNIKKGEKREEESGVYERGWKMGREKEEVEEGIKEGGRGERL